MVVLFLPVRAQGVKFEKGLDWSQILSEAKLEKKIIFIDFYASWCGPCKAMDRDVYTNEELGKIFNEKFVSVKVQMDSTKFDSDDIKLWYRTALKMQTDYSIKFFPTYIFFDFDGKPLHRGMGYKSKEDLVILANEACDSSKQIYTQLFKYRNGDRNYKEFGNLIKGVNLLGNKVESNEILLDYINNYIYSLDDNEIIEKDNASFLVKNSNLIKSTDHFFKLCFNNPKILDSVRVGMAGGLVENVIEREEINCFINNSNKNPNWSVLYDNIKRKYNSYYAEKLVIQTQVTYYHAKKDWKNFSYYFDKKISIFPLKMQTGFYGDAAKLNEAAWDVFLNCEDKTILKNALNWSKLSLKFIDNPDFKVHYLDTYANISYKLGDIKKALELERTVIESAKINLGRELPVDDLFIINYNKMREGKPTWDLNE